MNKISTLITVTYHIELYNEASLNEPLPSIMLLGYNIEVFYL